MKTYIVIPLHNEEAYIENILRELQNCKLTIVIVDDGSTDKTVQKVEKNKSKRVILLRHIINLGKGAAMKTGAKYAFMSGADSVIFLDGDGQHNPNEVSKFLEKLKDGKFDVVFGSRTLSLGVPFVRFVGNKFASALIAMLFGTYITDCLCGYRALNKKAYNALEWESNGYGVEVEMIARLKGKKLKFTEIPIETIYLDNLKGVTLMDGVSVVFSVVKWKLTL